MKKLRLPAAHFSLGPAFNMKADRACVQGPEGSPATPWADLEKWARQRWTSAGKEVYRWSGQV